MKIRRLILFGPLRHTNGSERWRRGPGSSQMHARMADVTFLVFCYGSERSHFLNTVVVVILIN